MTKREADSSVADDAGSEICSDSAAGTTEAVAAKLQAVEQMDYATLHREWRRVYRAHPPKRVSPNLLRLGVAWKIQEHAYGGLGAATKRRLADLAKTMKRDGDVTRNRVTRLKPGAQLVREWRGRTHKVIVLENGFEWKGTPWRSLSAIACEITGVHWSGPRFFGLQEKAGKQVGAEAGGTGDA